MKKLMSVLLSVSSVILLLVNIPQLYVTYTSKNVEGLSLLMWVGLSFVYGVFTLNSGWVNKDKHSLPGFVGGFIGCVGMVVMILLYR